MALAQRDRSLTWISVLVTGIATTLALYVSLGDPINIPKMLVLSLFAAGILGSAIPRFLTKPRMALSYGQIAVLIFALGLLIAAVFSDERYTAFYGAPGRNNGAISYTALAVICFVAMQSFNSKSVSKLRSVLIGIGAFLAFYGNLQITHRDPIKWNLLYNPIVGTLGNPDFVSALLGICAIATLWWILEDRRVGARFVGAALILFEIYIIRRCGSMQGLLIVAVGFAILVVASIWSWRKSAGYISASVALVGSLPILLGLLNKGPFAAHIYRGSIQSRLDYWHAALSMFKAHPLLGVGLDRVGENYWQYAPQVQHVIGQGTDNAHNVFLQLLATGGIVVFIPYLILIGVILVTSVRAILRATGKERFTLIALFAIWISFLLISTISIDTLGVAVWFWITGGALYSLARIQPVPVEVLHAKKGKLAKGKKVHPRASSYLGVTTATVLVILVFVLVSPPWTSSLAIQDLIRNNSGLNKSDFTAKLKDISTMWPTNPQTLISLADVSLRISDPKLANQFATEAVRKDARSYNGHNLNAIAYETQVQYGKAIPDRVVLLKLHPWSTTNMLLLVKDYLQVGEKMKARQIYGEILRIRPDGDDAKSAALLLKG